jgi:DNA polymerase III sliding clamp (beta) subunit (PCNA family)
MADKIVVRNMLTAVAAVRHAVSSDETRPHLCCVSLDLSDRREPCVVATDGHRLAIYRLRDEDVETATPAPSAINLAPKLVKEMTAKFVIAALKRYGSMLDEVTISADRVAVSPHPVWGVVGGEPSWRLRTVDAKFSSWRHFVPTRALEPEDRGPHTISVNPRYLLDAEEAHKLVARVQWASRSKPSKKDKEPSKNKLSAFVTRVELGPDEFAAMLVRSDVAALTCVVMPRKF